MPAARLLHMGAAEAGQAGAQPICRLSPEARGRHLQGGTGEPLKLYWLRAAPPSPAAGQHVRAGKGAGFKFENPAVGAGLSGEPGRNAQAPREGLRIPLRAPGSVLWPAGHLPLWSLPGFCFLLWRMGMVSWLLLLTTCREATTVAMKG